MTAMAAELARVEGEYAALRKEVRTDVERQLYAYDWHSQLGGAFTDAILVLFPHNRWLSSRCFARL